MIVDGLKRSTSRRRYRKDSREVQLIHTKPSQPLRWSEQPITFSRADHWVHIPDLGSYPLVIEPNIEGAQLAQTIIDGGSGLNVIFVDTLKKMDFDFKRLTECDEPFFGIVPGKVAYHMGRVSLPVTFDTEENFCTEYLSFEVADFKSSYHAILGRPMLARFMAISPTLHLPSVEDAGSQGSPYSLRRPADLIQVRQHGPGDCHDACLLRCLGCHGG
jgi:hypothetical protein